VKLTGISTQLEALIYDLELTGPYHVRPTPDAATIITDTDGLDTDKLTTHITELERH
jgi:hypothetical protein